MLSFIYTDRRTCDIIILYQIQVKQDKGQDLDGVLWVVSYECFTPSAVEVLVVRGLEQPKILKILKL